jgi:hypothetical protein
MLTSTSMGVSVTDSNRRVLTCTHGGMAGVSGLPPPRYQSNGLTGDVEVSDMSDLTSFARQVKLTLEQ